MNIQEFLSLMASGNYRITLHARKRMAERNITDADIRNSAITGSVLIMKDGKLKVKGFDLDGEELIVICVIEDGIIIVTVF